jgi:uncharacterized protein YdeI (YjbR/CyaY-like superfamily)
MSTQQKGKSPNPLFFPTPETFRAWLEQHHAEEIALWVGFYKTGTGRPSLTWPQSVDEALCFGWIDGVRKRLDDASYMIRFTPRKPRSIWSAINIGRVKALTKLGRMHPAGQQAFEKRASDRSAIYAYEQRHHATLDPAQTRLFRANPTAWAFFQAQPPWYRRTTAYWVISAKKDETRARRLAALMAESGAGRRIGLLTPPGLPARESVTTSVKRNPANRRSAR